MSDPAPIPKRKFLGIRYDKVGPFIVPPGFGAPRPLAPEESKVITLIGLAFLVMAYDHFIFTLALPQIQAGLDWSEESIGASLGLIRLGVLPSMVLAAMADKVGRRTLLMVTLFMAAIFTGLTAFAQTPEQFVAFQFLGKIFIYSEEALSIVVVAETVKPDLRGWALGALAALGGLGNGLASGIYGFVDVLPFGWRALFIIGTVPLLILVWLRRNLDETERFVDRKAIRDAVAPQLQSVGQRLKSAIAPIIDLARRYPKRTLALGASVVPFGMGNAAAVLFMSKHLQDTENGHGFDPGTVSLIYITGGAIAILGNLAAGRMADVMGRKRALTMALLVHTVAFYTLYAFQPGGIIVLAWVAAIFSLFAAEVIFNALGSELFPTDYRSTASSFRVIAYIVAGSVALGVESILYAYFGNHQTGIMILLGIIPIAAMVVWFAIPETAAKQLEDIAPDEA